MRKMQQGMKIMPTILAAILLACMGSLPGGSCQGVLIIDSMASLMNYMHVMAMLLLLLLHLLGLTTLLAWYINNQCDRI